MVFNDDYFNKLFIATTTLFLAGIYYLNNECNGIFIIYTL